ncbi:MAG TPA: helix-turn-helix transcriptional regulator [Acidimicrobiales bacterium]|nr:helix-turn-helix transcriptional regulator [Acidimicrobiales bacterium]
MRHRLVELREAATLTQEGLAEKLGISPKSVYRHEAGERTPQMDTRRKMASLYDVPLSVIHAALTEGVNGHVVRLRFTHFASLEQGATELRSCQQVSVPGLLQTADYATSLESVGATPASDEEIARRVEHRLHRQRVLDRLRLYALIDASVLLRETGGPDVMARQLDHLREMNERPNVAVRVIPLDQRAHAVGAGSFTIFTGEDQDMPYLVATNTLMGPAYHEFPILVAQYAATFSHLWEESDDLAQVDLLDERN